MGAFTSPTEKTAVALPIAPFWELADPCAPAASAELEPAFQSRASEGCVPLKEKGPQVPALAGIVFVILSLKHVQT